MLAACATATVGASAPAFAAPAGTPDPTFGTHGVSQLSFPGVAAEGRVLLPSSGGLVAIGDTSKDHVVVAGLHTDGSRDSGFGSLATWSSAAPTVGGAVSVGGTFVVALNGTPGNSFPERVELMGFDASGRPDSSFGSSGTVLLSGPGNAVRVLRGADGNLLVAGQQATTGNGPAATAVLWRVTARGQELGRATAPIDSSDPDAGVGAALQLPDGATLLVGTDPRLFLARFRTDGSPDTSFGAGGVRHVPRSAIAVDDVTLDDAGRLLVAGFHRGDIGRSVDVAVNPLLLRMSTGGAIDASLVSLGRGNPDGEVNELTGVRSTGGHIYASAPDGRIVGLDSSGRPDLRFGIGGTSVPARVQVTDGLGLTLTGTTALVTGRVFPATGYDNRLGVGRVALAGRGVTGPHAGSWVQLVRRSGQVTVRVPLASRDRSVPGRIAVPLAPRPASDGYGGTYAPPATIVTAGATATVVGTRGTARIRGARFELHKASRRVASLDLVSMRCSRRPSTTVAALRGSFDIRVGRLLIRSRTGRASLVIRRRCGKTRVQVTSGRFALINQKH